MKLAETPLPLQDRFLSRLARLEAAEQERLLSALEQLVACDLQPSLECVRRQSRGARDHETKISGSPRQRRPLARRSVLPLGDQLHVDGRDGHEEGHLARGETLPHDGGIEARQHLAGGAGPQGAEQRVYDPMCVVERQDMENPVLGGPAPRLDQRLDLGREAAVRAHDSLGATGGSAGVEDECAPERLHVGEPAASFGAPSLALRGE